MKEKRETIFEETVCDSIEELSEQVESMREEGLKTLSIIECTIVIKSSQPKSMSLLKDIVERGLSSPDRKNCVYITSKALGLFKSQWIIDLSKNPRIFGLESLQQTEAVLESFKDYLEEKITQISKGKVKLLSFDPRWINDSKVANPSLTSKKKIVHTPEWNKAIGDGLRGMIYKTKRTEGILWNWVGKKKVWINESIKVAA